MLIPSRVVEQMLVMGRLLNRSGVENTALCPDVLPLEETVDELGDSRLLPVLAGLRSVVEHESGGNQAKTDVEPCLLELSALCILSESVTLQFAQEPISLLPTYPEGLLDLDGVFVAVTL